MSIQKFRSLIDDFFGRGNFVMIRMPEVKKEYVHFEIPKNRKIIENQKLTVKRYMKLRQPKRINCNRKGRIEKTNNRQSGRG